METKKQQTKEKSNKVKIFKYTTTMTETTDIDSMPTLSSNDSSSSSSSSSNKKRQYKNISKYPSPTSPISLFPSVSSTRSSISGRSMTSSYSVSTRSSISTGTSRLSHHSNRSSTSYFSTQELLLNHDTEKEINYYYSDDDESIKKRNLIDHDIIHQPLSKSYLPPEGYSNAALTNTQSYPFSWRPHFVILTIGEGTCERRMIETLFNCKLNKDSHECTYKWIVDNRKALITICRVKHDNNDQKYISRLIQRLGISSILIFTEMKAIETVYKSLDKLFDILAPFKSKKDMNAWIQRLFFIFDQYEMDKPTAQCERQHVLQRIIPTITKRYELLLRPSILFLNLSMAKRSKRKTTAATTISSNSSIISSTSTNSSHSFNSIDDNDIPSIQKKIYQLHCKRILWTILTTYPKRWRTLAPYIPDESVINTTHQQYQLSSPTSVTSMINNKYKNDGDNSINNTNRHHHHLTHTKKPKNNKNVMMMTPTTTPTTKTSNVNIDDEEDEDEYEDDEEFSVFNFATVIHKGGYKSPPIVKVEKKLYDTSQLYGRDEKALIENEHRPRKNNNTNQSSDKPHTPASPASPSKKLTLTTYDKNERPHAFF
ncbi:unnamed protein product [Cunninghamella blakesleeana]